MAPLAPISGTADDWRKTAEEWRQLGATHLTINTMGAGLRGPDAHVKRLSEALAAVK